MSQVVATEVEIQAGAIRLAGVLRVPAGSGSRPGLVLTGPFTGVKEQVVGHYAAALAAAGLVTLAFDHRNFGASDGTVRQHEDSAGKLEDLRQATSYLTAHDRVDDGRLGCVGISLGGVTRCGTPPLIRGSAPWLSSPAPSTTPGRCKGGWASKPTDRR